MWQNTAMWLDHTVQCSRTQLVYTVYQTLPFFRESGSCLCYSIQLQYLQLLGNHSISCIWYVVTTQDCSLPTLLCCWCTNTDVTCSTTCQVGVYSDKLNVEVRIGDFTESKQFNGSNKPVYEIEATKSLYTISCITMQTCSLPIHVVDV